MSVKPAVLMDVFITAVRTGNAENGTLGWTEAIYAHLLKKILSRDVLLVWLGCV
jgi:hypothetical protein